MREMSIRSFAPPPSVPHTPSSFPPLYYLCILMFTLTVRYSRAIRRGERIYVSGTTATDAQGLHVGGGDAFAQAVFILDKIEAAIRALGGRIEDVVRTRMYVIIYNIYI